MNLSKNFLTFSLLFFGLLISSTTLGQTTEEIKTKKTEPTVEFTAEEIEKIKTVIEAQLKTRISDAEFSAFGKANEKNLALFKLVNKSQKENPFFSQQHISYVIKTMEEELGFRKPSHKLLGTPESKESNKRRKSPRVSKLPKGRGDSINK